ncbi:MAG: ECF transporter S component [Saccharofermentans sp.]|nr:ECF transporter S component [Saccharofermentans sp.]
MSDQRRHLRKITFAGLLAAFIFVGTEIHVPTAIGHVNLGDVVILVSSYILGPIAAIPAAIGSALADLLAGYPQYIAPTFVIKGVMGLVAGLILRRKPDIKVPFYKRLIAAILAEAIMLGGYFVFESLMYGSTAATGSLIPNLIQAAAGIIGSIPLTYVKSFDNVRL